MPSVNDKPAPRDSSSVLESKLRIISEEIRQLEQARDYIVNQLRGTGTV